MASRPERTAIRKKRSSPAAALAGAFFAGAAFLAGAFFAAVRFAGAAFLAGAFFAAVVLAVVTSSPLCVMRRSNRSAVSHGLVYALR